MNLHDAFGYGKARRQRILLSISLAIFVDTQLNSSKIQLLISEVLNIRSIGLDSLPISA